MKLKIDLKQIADLAGIALNEDEESIISAEFETVLTRMKSLLDVNVENIPPTFTLGDADRLRLAKDTPHQSLPREVVMEYAPSIDNGYFKVPRESQSV